MYILPTSTVWTADIDRLGPRCADWAGAELSPNVTDSTQCAKASDMYAFGLLAFEVRINSFECYVHGSLSRGRFSRDIPRSSS